MIVYYSIKNKQINRFIYFKHMSITVKNKSTSPVNCAAVIKSSNIFQHHNRKGMSLLIKKNKLTSLKLIPF